MVIRSLRRQADTSGVLIGQMSGNCAANQFVRSRSLLQLLFEILHRPGASGLIRGPEEISRIAKRIVAAGLQPAEFFGS
jgi:hypothetical protein